MLRDSPQYLEQCTSYSFGIHVLEDPNGRKGVLLKFERPRDFELWQIGKDQDEATFVRNARFVFAAINAVRSNPKVHGPEFSNFWRDRLVSLTLPNG